MALARDALLRDLKARLARMERPAAGLEAIPFAGAEAGEAALARGSLHEVMAPLAADRPAALGFLAGLLAVLAAQAPGPLLWLESGREAREGGSVYGPGLAGFGLPPDRLLLVRPRKETALLWALEECAKERGLLAVAGILGEGRACDLTASRRLQLAAERGGAPVLLFRGAGDAPASAGQTRWRVGPAPSRAPPWDAGGLGPPCWSVTLERRRDGPPKTWVMEWDDAACAFAVAAPLADRPARPASAAGGGRAA